MAIDVPPRVGLNRVIFRRYAWYFTVYKSELVYILLPTSSLRPPIALALHNKLAPGFRCKRTLRTEELSRNVQSLASHNDDVLAIEQLLSHCTGQPTKEMALAIDGDL